jgi:hypothetical protein
MVGYLTDIAMASQQPPSTPSGNLVLLFAAASIPEGMLARGLLESQGVPVVVKGESEGPYRIGPVYLWVPEELEVQARMILEEAVADASTDDVDAQGDQEGP